MAMRQREEQPFVEVIRNRKKGLERTRLLSISSIALISALVGSFGLLFTVRSDYSRRDLSVFSSDLGQHQKQIDMQVFTLTKQVDDLRQVLGDLAQRSNSGSAKNGEGVTTLSTEDRIALANAEKRDSDLSQRLSSLEGALLQTPEKAVALPLLKQQLTDIEEKNKGDAENLHGEINRLYSMMQWFLGLMITLIVGVGGLAVNSFRQSSEKNKGGELHRHHDAEPENRPPTEKTA